VPDYPARFEEVVEEQRQETRGFSMNWSKLSRTRERPSHSPTSRWTSVRTGP
jgi:hypothetical protein